LLRNPFGHGQPRPVERIRHSVGRLGRQLMVLLASLALAAALVPATPATAQASELSGANLSPTCISISRTIFTLEPPCIIDITHSAVSVGAPSSAGTFVTTAFGWTAEADSHLVDRILGTSPGPVSAHVEWGDGSAPVQIGANLSRQGSVEYVPASSRSVMGHTYTAAGTYTVTLSARLWLSDTCTGVCPPAAAPAPYYTTAQVSSTVVVGPITPSVAFTAAPPSTVKVGAPASVALATGTIDPDAWYNVYMGWNEEDEPALLSPTGATGTQSWLPATYAALSHTFTDVGVYRVWARAVECTRSPFVGAPCTEGPWSGTIPIRTVSTFVTVLPNPIAATVAGSQKFGSASPTVGYTASLPSGVTISGTVTCTTVNGGTPINASLGAGTYTIDGASCSGLTSSSPDNYPVGYVGGSLTVTAAVPVVVSGGHTFGNFDDIYFNHVAGTASPDSSVTVTGTTVNCTAVAGGAQITSVLDVGTYALDPSSCSGLSPSDTTYDLNLSGTYTVTVRTYPVTISGSWLSGATPSLVASAPPQAFLELTGTLTGCSVDVAGVTTTVDSSLAPGTYPIVDCSGLSLTGPWASNFVIGYAGSVTVTAPTFPVAVSGTWTYGASPALAFTATAPDGVTVTGTGTCTTVDGGTPLNASLPVGTHTIDPSSCSGLTAPATAYTATYSGSVEVEPAALVITASSATMTYGGTVPTITPSYSGFVNGDDAGNVKTAPTCSTTATASSTVGTYTSSCSGAGAANYTFSYVPGSVTVTYGITALHSQVAANKSGSTIPIKVQLMDGDGTNISSAAVVLTLKATAVTPNPGSQPTGTFTFIASSEVGPMYQYDLKTKRYPKGTYTLWFSVTGDPIPHSVAFVIR